ncbi:hypothetical protein BJF83_19085 [Nocardiopsis sp. CNR-923]|uniref:hypothetical protein n=1 Tax=Nocardiopsis sp. CNR-923 TaxID=1904965 RepID=UPI0009617498|nr:hypothetical protein [Nocardiopsis sp. CNR-923]OLT27113.1 hypothetical protein BJF83_19085 [Nocardiopsis sp. CNR-923]
MFDDVIEWFKGLFGGAAEEMAQGASETVDGAAESAQAYGEGAVGGATEAAQNHGEEALGGASETAQGFQDQADAVGGIVEDPGGAAADAATDHLYGDGR